ncbi:MAG: HU family DNA-binding protein [bacterium]|nr:HU family DNA-binding protein [bacterium]MDE0241536.1 HU family DNA-binding protein [bacterium]MDE0415998.1 HU family DNA-binding protein [bacterium]
MKKLDYVERVADEADMMKQAAEDAVVAVFTAIARALARGEDVAIAGFGKFSRIGRPARQGRNPRTGEPLVIGASNTVSFRASKTLKNALN